jgi:hypothetical protein
MSPSRKSTPRAPGPSRPNYLSDLMVPRPDPHDQGAALSCFGRAGHGNDPYKHDLCTGYINDISHQSGRRILYRRFSILVCVTLMATSCSVVPPGRLGSPVPEEGPFAPGAGEQTVVWGSRRNSRWTCRVAAASRSAAVVQVHAKLGATMLRMAQLYTDVTDLCKDLSVTRHTWYRHVAPDGPIWPDVKKLQGVGQARHLSRVSAAVGD